VFVLLLAACQSGAAAGTPCARSTECSNPLVCRLGRCRSECAANRDCPLGAQCFLDPAGLGACELEADHQCGSGGTVCPSGLTCLGSECVRACTMSSDCPADGLCSVVTGSSTSVCTDPRTPADAGPPIDASADAGPICTPLQAIHVCNGRDFSCAVRPDHSVVCWGQGESGVLGIDPNSLATCDAVGGPSHCAPTPMPLMLEGGSAPLDRVEQLACGEDFACALRTGGEVRCWGRNYAGMVGASGDGIAGARQVADAMTHLPIADATSIAVGLTHACAIVGAGVATHVVCWGANDQAQLGMAPTPFVTPTTSANLSARGTPLLLFTMSNTTCVVFDAMGTATVACLGSNDHGQLGIDPATLTRQATLADIVSLSVSSTQPVVSGGDGHACAIDAGGHLACWGWNIQGSLGRSDASEYPALTPASVLGPASTMTFDRVFSGPSRHTNCATSGNALWCWGANVGAQAAQPTGDDVLEPTIVVGLPAIAEGSCGEQHCCAVDAAQNVWCWGGDDVGQLGRGATGAMTPIPARVCAP
jgi:alpha-tubulin suppressor-like RCC1 family protein